MGNGSNFVRTNCCLFEDVILRKGACLCCIDTDKVEVGLLCKQQWDSGGVNERFPGALNSLSSHHTFVELWLRSRINVKCGAVWQSLVLFLKTSDKTCWCTKTIPKILCVQPNHKELARAARSQDLVYTTNKSLSCGGRRIFFSLF